MKRFIAGAVCPRCRAVDRIVVEEVPAAGEDGQGPERDAPMRRRRCVSCGYSDTLLPGAPAEPARRFSRGPSNDASASPVRILDPASARRPVPGGGSGGTTEPDEE